MSNEENEKSKLEELKTIYKDVNSQLEERSKELSTLKMKIPTTEKSLRDATMELNSVKNEETKLVTQIRKDRSHLEEKRNSIQTSRSQGKVLNSLMQQKREGNCPGVYGRLV